MRPTVFDLGDGFKVAAADNTKILLATFPVRAYWCRVGALRQLDQRARGCFTPRNLD
jgi:hypothetical protein